MKSEYNDIPKEPLDSNEMKNNHITNYSKFSSNFNHSSETNQLNTNCEVIDKKKDNSDIFEKTKNKSSSEGVGNSSNINNNKQMLENLNDMRITMTNILFVIGFNKKFISKSREELEGENYFGHYGKVLKLVINEFPYDKSNKNGPFYSIHINYHDEKETSHAILALHDKLIDKNRIKASYGTTKFCKNFIDKKPCFNKECLFYHKIDNSLIMNKVRLYYI